MSYLSLLQHIARMRVLLFVLSMASRLFTATHAKRALVSGDTVGKADGCEDIKMYITEDRFSYVGRKAVAF